MKKNTIKAPMAADAGDDYVEAMKQAKLQHYASAIPELERRGICYAPAISLLVDEL